ncbi:MAG: DUF4197 domain-containing protein [Candidatus Auribacterota bacterium]|jgi:hypothetical protein|nr:DUF4197 domain-containing protein [Candidatus Auribacterota bacterium]
MKSKLLMFTFFITAITVFGNYTVCSGAGIFEKLGLFRSTSLSDTKIAGGLKDALKVAVDNAVKLTGKENGFLKNEAIKILLPEKIQLVEKGLRVIGAGPAIDEFVLSMNRAAEHAVPQAESIFIDAIMKLTFDDVMGIYKGSETAATDYFKRTTHDNLVEAFLPAARTTMDKYSVTQQYNSLLDRYKKIPLSQNVPVPEIDRYVVEKTIDGLFYVMAQQERKIRTDPSARVTDLLKEIFK